MIFQSFGLFCLLCFFVTNSVISYSCFTQHNVAIENGPSLVVFCFAFFVEKKKKNGDLYLITCWYFSVCLSIFLPFCLSYCLSIYQSVCLSFYLSVVLSVYRSLYLSVCLSFYLSISLSFCLSDCRSVHLCVFFICLYFFISVYIPFFLFFVVVSIQKGHKYRQKKNPFVCLFLCLN